MLSVCKHGPVKPHNTDQFYISNQTRHLLNCVPMVTELHRIKCFPFLDMNTDMYAQDHLEKKTWWKMKSGITGIYPFKIYPRRKLFRTSVSHVLSLLIIPELQWMA